MSIVVTEPLDPVCMNWLTSRAEVVVCSSDSPAFGGHLASARGLIVRTYTLVTPSLLDAAPHLEAVGRAGVGLDNIDLDACCARGVEVVYTPDANTQAVAEYVLGLILDAVRPRVTLEAHTPDAYFHRLRKEQVGAQLDQMTLGILGFGRIGRRLGRIAHAVGMDLLVNDLMPEADLRSAVSYPITIVDKEQLYRRSDILSIHVDGRLENRHLINPASLAQLRPGCLLINTSRGMVVDPVALGQWAQVARSKGGKAVLDVHDPEPPAGDDPLYHHPNVRLLPHLASRTEVALQNMSWVVRDVVAVLEGHPPQFPAPPARE